MWLWSLRDPKIPGQQAGDPGEPLAKLQPKSENPESQGVSSIVKAGRLETQEELVFQFGSQGRRMVMFPLHSEAGEIPSYFGKG